MTLSNKAFPMKHLHTYYKISLMREYNMYTKY